MSAEIEQSDQDYVATVEVVQPNGEWVVVARAVDSLGGLADWAKNGVGLDCMNERTDIDNLTSPSDQWMDDYHDLVTDEQGNVVEPADSDIAPYGYRHYGELEGGGSLQAQSQAPADPKARLVRIYPDLGPAERWSEEELREIVEDPTGSYTVWVHPEPLEYSVENVAAYIRYAFGLDDDKERLTLVPAADEYSSSFAMESYRMKLDFGGGLSKEEEEDWDRVTELYFHHPYAQKDPWS